jgi:hypothetical protein
MSVKVVLSLSLALGISAGSDSDAGRPTLDCSDVVVTPVCLYARDV